MTEDTAPDNSKRGGGCLGGCGRCLGIIVGGLAIVVLAFVVLRALRPDPNKLFSGASDPFAEAVLEDMLISAGVQGAQVTVIPIKGSDKQLAYIVFDDSSGLSMGSLTRGGEENLAGALLQLDAANRSQDLNIGPVAMEYRGESGEPLFSVVTDQEDISAFADGEMSREELLSNTDINLANLLDGVDLLSNASGQ